ncbi:MAG: MBL fold metallo-hydrolase [Acidobacteria bacterium]|nr:MBL fold metallo-hydrolase [Acidobacteriota bacterium]
MKLRFWGVRGSTPTPWRESLRYGGNTSCVEVRTARGDVFIFDCGTGLRPLGKELMEERGHASISAFIFLSHYHWDHIQGIPFFEPLYNPENHFFFHSFPAHTQTVQRALEEQMSDPYFPVDMGAMAAHRHFYNLCNDQVEFNGTRLTAMRLNHPQGCLGYRLECGSRAIAYATDNEPGKADFDRNVRSLAEGADVLIYDAQYTPLEYVNFKKGWGHSTWREAVTIAREAGVKTLVLFHHDPDHNDAMIDSIVHEAAREFPGVLAAAEGLEIDLSGEQTAIRMPAERRAGDRRLVHLPLVVEGRRADGLSFVEHTILENLSLSGAFFELENEPDPRRELTIHLKLSSEPSDTARVLQVVSRVVRTEDAEQPNKRGVAVVFPPH